MSPLTLAHGPPGLEATYQWDQLARPLGQPPGTLPRYKIEKITGWGGLGEIEDLRDVNTGRIGERAYPSSMKGKTLTFEGSIEAFTYEDMRMLSTALRGGFGDCFGEHRMVVAPYTGWGSQQFTFTARTLALDMDEEQTFGPTSVPSPWQRAFVLSMRLSDPRLYAWPDPVSAAGGSSQIVTNLGSAPVDPVITLTGITDPTDTWVRNLTIDKQLFFTELGDTSDIVIDFHNRTIYQGGYESSAFLLPNASNWWDEGVPGLIPGANQITAHSNQTVVFYHGFY